MKNKNQTTVEDELLEELFCDTYGTDDFETAVEAFEHELDKPVFESEDDLEVYLENHQNDNELLKEAWDLDLWNNSVSELVNQCRLQFGVLNLYYVTKVLEQWQGDWKRLCED